MREIKFRGWDILKNEMINNVAILGIYENFITTFCTDAIHNSQDWWGEKGFSCAFHLMQFTGLKDKNGKEIYESDIVRILYTDWSSKSDSDPRTIEQYLIDISHVGQVVFNDNSWEVKKHSIKYNDFIFSSINHGKYGFIEVIGNIYENPELLS